MSELRVTTAQIEEVRRLAVLRGVTWGQFQGALDDGRLLAFLDGLVPAVEQVGVKKFPLWLELEVGVLTREGLLQKIASSGRHISAFAQSMVASEKFAVLSEPQLLKLGRATVRELGFIKNPTTMELWERLAVLGAKKCHPSVGPHLRLVCPEQILDGWIWCYMEQIPVMNNQPSVWNIGSSSDGSKRWLDGGCVISSSKWGLSHMVVFSIDDSGLLV